MLHFSCDYSEGAHEKVLRRLIETNMEHLPGYGADEYTVSAKQKIRTACGDDKADVFFLVGGTQTNAVIIGAILKSYEGIISADTGHISVHEAGAIEFTGHKVMTLAHADGKLRAETVEKYIETFYADENHEHMVFPGMVYISHPTEYGTLYTKKELEALSEVCRRFDIPLYMDGARMGYALASHDTDVKLSDIARLCDVFYIGGTKVGALCGEAVVFPRGKAPKYFMTTVKQRGAMLAKGRLLGIQFDTLFTDDLYMDISRHAVDMADKLKGGLSALGYRFFIESPTNQQFIILENEKMKQLREKVSFSFWEKYDDAHTVIRLATSWATQEKDVDKLLKLLAEL